MLDDMKICPLQIIEIPEEERRCDCLKEKCAWWVEDKQKCAVAAAGERIRGR